MNKDEIKKLAFDLYKNALEDEAAHMELRMIRDRQQPRFEALKDSHPDIYNDFMLARQGPHEILRSNRIDRLMVLKEIIEGKYDE